MAMVTRMGQFSSARLLVQRWLAPASLAAGLWAAGLICAPGAAAQGEPCGPARQSWDRLVASNASPHSMLDAYRTIPRGCVAERAEALLVIGQSARQAGYLLEADASGAPIITRVQAAPSSPPIGAPVATPVAARGPTSTLTDADLLAAPTARDQQNPPAALARLERETTITLTGTLQADGRFAWALTSEQPGDSGLVNYAIRLAERYRARTGRPDGASLVGAELQRTFRFRPNRDFRR
jgi:hypothetical protein